MALILKASNSQPESEPFHFFDLPELVIHKILKEYVPVSVKMGVLSQIPDFNPYLQQKSLWFQPTLKLFQLAGSIKSGWYVECDKLPTFYYFLIDYFDLSVTLHYFNIENKKCRIAVQDKKSPKEHSVILERFITFKNFPTLSFVKENDLLVYHYEDKHRNIYFWIFRPKKIVHWSRNRQLYKLRNNTCSMLDEVFYNTSLFTLTLNDDFSVLLQQYQVSQKVISNCFVTVLLPLIFQPCAEKRPYELDNKPWECQSCKKGSNYVHTYFKETFVDFDKNLISEVTTSFYEKEEKIPVY